MAKLSDPQRKMLTRALDSARNTKPGQAYHGTLVSGPEYRTAIALENRGLVKVRYQGPGDRGWLEIFPDEVRRMQAEKILADVLNEHADGQYRHDDFNTAASAVAFAIENGWKA